MSDLPPRHRLAAALAILALAAALALLFLFSIVAGPVVLVAVLVVAVGALLRAVVDARRRRPTTLRIDVWQRRDIPTDEEVRRN